MDVNSIFNLLNCGPGFSSPGFVRGARIEPTDILAVGATSVSLGPSADESDTGEVIPFTSEPKKDIIPFLHSFLPLPPNCDLT